MTEPGFHELDIDDHIKELQQEYLQELSEKIISIDNLILKLEKSSTPESEMRGIVGMVHTMKGTAGSYDLGFISTVCHNFEDYVAALRVSNSDLKTHADNFLKFTGLLAEYTDAYIADNGISAEEFKQKLLNLVASESSITTKKHRVLIIENTKSMIHQYSKILKRLNVEASFAKHGYDALGRLLKEDFDSLITVEQTEMLDGSSLIASLRVIKSNNRKIPAILITSDVSLELSAPHNPAYVLIKKPGLLNDLEKLYTEFSRQTESVNNINETKVEPADDKTTVQNRELQKILYIDDDKDLQPLVKLGLKKLPGLVEAEYHTSAKEALNIMHRFCPDLILLDVMMPGMDGPTVFKKLQDNKEFKSIPVIFLTGKDTDEERKELMELGAAGVINKPIKVKTIADTIYAIWSNIH